MLVNGSRITMSKPDHPTIVFQTMDGREISIDLNRETFHSVCRLLQTAVEATDWDVEFQIAEAADAPDERPEKLN